jgi:hypothetical protein
MDPALNTLTVVTADDAAWLPYPGSPRNYNIDPTIAEALKLEFCSPAQLMAVMDLMKVSGINIDNLAVHDSADNWNYPPYKFLAYLRDNGPKVYSLKGNIVTDINVGAFINMQRIKGLNNPAGVEVGGDVISVYFVNPNFPWLIWSKV